MQTIYDLSLKQMEEMLAQKGQKPYRAKQLYTWLYKKRVDDFAKMTDLPATLIETLQNEYTLQPMAEIERQVARDKTTKYLFEMNDGASVETVLMHFHFGESLCVSSQVGCNMGCRFCASAIGGKLRNLETGEITDQILKAEKDSGLKISNIVMVYFIVKNLQHLFSSLKVFQQLST